MIRIVLALFFCTLVQAQDIIEFKGRVLNDSLEKASLNVVNISLKKGTITNVKGEFIITARENDTIHISGLNYEPRQFVVNTSMFNRERISLYLIPKVTELDEVRISNIELTGDIKKDVLSTSLAPNSTAHRLGIPENKHRTYTPEERKLYAASSGVLSGLINAISGRTAMLKKHLEVSQLQAKVYYTRSQFSDSLYMKELKVSEDLIEDFVYYVFEDEQALHYVDESNLLELLDYMMIKSKQYLALKQQEH